MQLCVYRTLSFVSFLHPAAAIDCVCSRDRDHVAPDFHEHATLGSLFFCGGDGVLIWADVNYACNTAAVSTVSEGTIYLAPASPVVISV